VISDSGVSGNSLHFPCRSTIEGRLVISASGVGGSSLHSHCRSRVEGR